LRINSDWHRFWPEYRGKFLLTINDHETMREVFSGHAIEEVEVSYSIGKDDKSRGEYGELMVMNY